MLIDSCHCDCEQHHGDGNDERDVDELFVGDARRHQHVAIGKHHAERPVGRGDTAKHQT